MRAITILFLLAMASAPAAAQNLNQNSAHRAVDGNSSLSNSEQQKPRSEPRTERIRIQDQGSTVDELRIGGQTRSITVQPAANGAPAYEVLPSDGVRNRPQNGSESTTGPRVWNVLKF